LTRPQARRHLIDRLRRAPRHGGPARSRWTLALVAAAAVWLAGLTLSGRWRLLRRLGIVYRRGQGHLHSPDPDYAAKVAAVRAARRQVDAAGGTAVLLYLDEFTYYRRPEPAPVYAPAGGPGPPAEHGHGANRKRRVIGALDVVTGRLFSWQGGKAGVAELGRFYDRLRAAYPDAATIYVAQDNWPVHFLPAVTGPLAGGPVRVLRLPTYAPWTNPIEKVWRKLRQEVLRMHDYGDDWAGLQAAVTEWLARAADDPDGLRRYTGLRRRRKRRVTLG
jgi:hypothetical protein